MKNNLTVTKSDLFSPKWPQLRPSILSLPHSPFTHVYPLLISKVVASTSHLRPFCSAWCMFAYMVSFFVILSSIYQHMSAILEGVAERCCYAMWRPHSWQTYNFMRAIYRTHLVRIVSVRASKHLKPHFWLAKCSSALYCSRLFGRYFIHLFIYYCLLRILAKKRF